MTKLISLVIPTRNRAECLLDSVSVALKHAADLEIVVVDNSDTDALRSALAEPIANGHVVYSYCAAPLSVVTNFERGFDLATGDYVMFIGDDDCIGPGVIEVARWAQRADIDAVISYRHRFIANYFWPGVKSKFYGDAYSASLFVHPFTGRAEPLNALAALRHVAQRPGGNLGALPRAYHGLVARRLLLDIRLAHGHVFGGISPDIYNATLVAAHCRNAWAVDYPFVIPGASVSSTAAQGAARNEQGRLDQTEHITRFGSSLQWIPSIPAYYSGPIVWAHSLVMALQAVPAVGIQAHHGRLYAKCLFSGRRLIRPVWAAWKAHAVAVGHIRAALELTVGLVAEFGTLAGRIAIRLLSPGAGGSAKRLSDLPKISAAHHRLSQLASKVPLALD